ncbi:TIGR03086 family protein [Streptoalloteichus tenebrarius]|uniref:TIGR03086 family protein n=1 Tax=Streptoalloteichus tenebrarius (strain ATCC 17920 / DSM 40477 / JCM 4838 / CBS 697.72 / NBRC 16177 / NCIMB 11028 / NRRL B-12390 / A12253. 1 / ISP 5477) TaxID=1933 RepID=A0ABT1I1T2_STRSD|nr:TIGR03086 family metal-binding protein [Streptoalloteichus tenebrarius]MCP2261747.1 TIGR03086 family protein [Streptoalloteichus tenebrarius]BFF00802.1 TIGR03086 family metal-binding protein [Streptoalloteichus tenebrarius]
MDTVDLVGPGLAFTRSKIVGMGAAGLDGPTPCSEWTLRQLLNHLIGTMGALGRVLGGEVVDPAEMNPSVTSAADHVGQDPLAAFDAAAAVALAARPTDERAMSRPCAMPVGELPAGAVANLLALDATVHGWDVARATGQDPTIPDELAERILAFARGFVRPSVRGGAIGEEVPVAADASPSDRLVAFLGRRP